jgi:GNAT superfamily N-acetyltransferase
VSTPLAIAAVAALAAAAELSRRGSPARKSRHDHVEVRFQPSDTAPIAYLWVDGVRRGHLQANRIEPDDLYDFEEDEPGGGRNPVVYECSDVIQDLMERYGGNASVFMVWRTAIDPDFRGHGYGVLLYEEMLSHLEQTEGRHIILIPEACVEDGSTSDDALRVWDSLSRRYHSMGDAVSSQRRSGSTQRKQGWPPPFAGLAEREAFDTAHQGIDANPLKELDEESLSELEDWRIEDYLGWLAEQVRLGRRGRNTYWYGKLPELSVDKLLSLPGQKGEHLRMDSRPSRQKILRLEASMREHGFHPDRAIQVFVWGDGTAKVWEGNHRLRAAAAAGLKTIPVDWKYVAGSERNPKAAHASDFAVSGSPNAPYWLKAGEPRRESFEVWHQTSPQAQQAIRRQGFRLDLPRARESDTEMPDGVFLKFHDRPVGVVRGNPVQMRVRAQVDNLLRVRNRRELVALLENDAEYRKLASDRKMVDVEYGRRVDELEEELDQIYKRVWEQHRRINPNDPRRRLQHDEYPELHAADRRIKAVIDEWGRETDRASALLRKRITAFLRELGYDAVLMEHDRGSRGRTVRTLVVLDPSRVTPLGTL